MKKIQTFIFRKYSPRQILLIAVLFHYCCYIIMQTLALYAETWRGTSIDDLLHSNLPTLKIFQFYNTSIWLVLLIASITYLSIKNKIAAIQYLFIGGLTSLLRGLFIPLTKLGPPKGVWIPKYMQNLTIDNIDFSLLLRQWFPVDIFWGGNYNSAAFLTQDLFFSGHTASSFLLILVVKKGTIERKIFWLYHVITLVSLLFTRLHYTIDIVSAWFVVYAVYSFFEKRDFWVDLNKV